MENIESKLINIVKNNTDIFSKEEELFLEEIGDGNINYVYRIKNKTNKSLIIKRGDELLRSSGRKLDKNRTYIEALSLINYNKNTPGLSPEVYYYDRDEAIIIMEDLSYHKSLRENLMNQKKCKQLVYKITDFIIFNSLNMSDFILDSHEKKNKIKEFINPDLCKITEDLVFTEPYNDYKNRNIILKENIEFVKENIYEDENLKLEVSHLKHKFLTSTEALIHGDLHSGSIFIDEEDVKVIDPEFAFFGPLSYDIGNFLGNLLIASNYNNIIIKNFDMGVWIECQIVKFIALFKKNAKKFLYNNCEEVLLKNRDYIDYYIDNLIDESIQMAGLEIIRRVIGDAKVEEIESIKDIKERAILERELIISAKSLIVNKKLNYHCNN